MSYLTPVLMQAAIAFNFILVVFFVLFILIGLPIISGLLMRTIWKIQGKEDYIESKTPYYKTPLVYFPVLLLSLGIVLLIFILLFYLILTLFPDLLAYS